MEKVIRLRESELGRLAIALLVEQGLERGIVLDASLEGMVLEVTGRLGIQPEKGLALGRELAHRLVDRALPLKPTAKAESKVDGAAMLSSLGPLISNLRPFLSMLGQKLGTANAVPDLPKPTKRRRAKKAKTGPRRRKTKQKPASRKDGKK